MIWCGLSISTPSVAVSRGWGRVAVTRAAWVSGPAMPSGWRRAQPWKAITTCAVRSPKLPSGSTSQYPSERRRCCSRCTAGPDIPVRSVGTSGVKLGVGEPDGSTLGDTVGPLDGEGEGEELGERLGDGAGDVVAAGTDGLAEGAAGSAAREWDELIASPAAAPPPTATTATATQSIRHHRRRACRPPRTLVPVLPHPVPARCPHRRPDPPVLERPRGRLHSRGELGVVGPGRDLHRGAHAVRGGAVPPGLLHGPAGFAGTVVRPRRGRLRVGGLVWTALSSTSRRQ